MDRQLLRFVYVSKIKSQNDIRLEHVFCLKPNICERKMPYFHTLKD